LEQSGNPYTLGKNKENIEPRLNGQDLGLNSVNREEAKDVKGIFLLVFY